MSAEIFEARVLDGPDVAVTGVIAKDVEPPERTNCFIDDSNRSLRIGYVEVDGSNAISETLDEIVELPRITRRGHQRVTGVEHSFRKRPTQSTRTASNQPNHLR